MRGIRSIAVGERLYQFTSHYLCLQFCNTFVTHLSPHQFGIKAKKNCKKIIHDIKCILDLHLDWVILQLDVANAHNSMSQGVIF
jgi:hypothetical protein